MPDVRETKAFALLMKCAGRQFILEALMRNNNCIVHAARELQVNRTHFYKLMRRYGARPLKPARQKRGNAEWRALGS